MNLLDLFVKIGIKDETESKLGDIKQRIGNGLATAAKVGTAAIAATTTAVAALTKASVEQYADYEQLTGGVKKLFGNSSKQLMQFANNAYKNAGLSSNEYMETVTSFSASLISSLGNDTDAAVGYANQAIQDMSDNANTFGTDIASIQNAYQGFAKQNYTMLDNLKLGYGGTKEEMERLLRDAEEYEGFIENSLSVENFADIVTAIGIIQDKMKITGTTAKEAGTTISGSAGMVKSAWKNVMIAMSGGTDEFSTDLKSSIEALTSSTMQLFSNLMPVIEQVLYGIGTLVEGLAPVIAEKLPVLVETLLPSLVTAVTSLISGAAGAIPTIITVITESLPMILDAGMQIITAIGQGLFENLDLILDTGLKIIMTLLEGLLNNSDKIADAVIQVINTLIQFFTEHTEEVVSMGIQIITSLVTGLAEALPQIMEAVPQIIGAFNSAIISNLPNIIEAGATVLSNFIQGLVANLAGVVTAAINIFQSIKNVIGGLGGEAWSWGSDLIVNFINGITAWIGELWSRVRGIAQGIRDYLGFSEPKLGPLSNFHTYAPDMMKLFAEGITDNAGLISDAFNDSVDIGMKGIPDTQRSVYGGMSGAVEEIVLNVTSEIDGETLARNMYRYNVAEQKRHGPSYA